MTDALIVVRDPDYPGDYSGPGPEGIRTSLVAIQPWPSIREVSAGR